MAGLSLSVDVDVSKIPDVIIDDAIIAQWLTERLDDARNHFISEASGASPSAPGAYPGLRTGQLVGSISGPQVSGRSGSISAGVGYAGFLASGTRKMAKRKMLAEAVDESLSARPEAEQLAKAVRFGYE